MTAGIEMLNLLNQRGVYTKLEDLSSSLVKGFRSASVAAGVPIHVSRVGSLLTAFFIDDETPVIDYESAKRADTKLFARFFRRLLAEGIYWPPSQFEAAFVSLAHSGEDIRTTVEAIEKALRSLS